MATRTRVPRTGRVEVAVDAPAEAVWRLVVDVTRTGEWSHECGQVRWLDGAATAAPGARFAGRNRTGPWRWTRTCEVLSVDAPRSIAWRTVPSWRFVDSTDWRISVEPDGSGARIVQTFQVTRCPDWWEHLVSRLVPAHLDRTEGLTQDLVRLGRVAAADEAGAAGRSA